MGNDKAGNCHLGHECTYQFFHYPDVLCTPCCNWLVQYKQCRLCGKGNQLLLPSRQVSSFHISKIFDIHHPHPVPHAFLDKNRRFMHGTKTECDIIPGLKVEKDYGVLEYVPDAAVFNRDIHPGTRIEEHRVLGADRS